MRHRCRCTVNRITRIRLFPLFFHDGCSQSSRFSTAGQGERSSGNEIGNDPNNVLITKGLTASAYVGSCVCASKNLSKPSDFYVRVGDHIPFKILGLERPRPTLVLYGVKKKISVTGAILAEKINVR